MKWSKTYLNSRAGKLFIDSEDIDFSSEDFSKSLNVKQIENVHVDYEGLYDSFAESLKLNIKLTSTLLIPCGRTNELVNYKINVNQNIVYSFVDSVDEETIVVNGLVIDTYEEIRQLIILEIPIVVYKEGTSPIIPKKEDAIDPRLAKLKDLLK